MISPSTRVRYVEGGIGVAYNAHTGEERHIAGVDRVGLSLGSRGEDGLYRALKGSAKEVYLVGSAFAPRRLVEATIQGANIGRMI